MSFIGDEKYGSDKVIKNNAIVVNPYKKSKQTYEYNPVFYYLPVDKEYFEEKGFKANTPSI